MFMLGFPLLLIPFAIYNIIAFLMPGVAWTGVVSHGSHGVGGRLDDVGRGHARRAGDPAAVRRNHEIDRASAYAPSSITRCR